MFLLSCLGRIPRFERMTVPYGYDLLPGVNMSLNSAQKADIVKEFQLADQDTGSPEVQVSLMTGRIKYLTEHFKTHKKDFHSRRGLQALVNKRRKLLKYLKRNNQLRYVTLIQKLGLRDSY